MLAEQLWNVRKRKESKITVRYPFLEGRQDLPLEMKGTAEVIMWKWENQECSLRAF